MFADGKKTKAGMNCIGMDGIIKECLVSIGANLLLKHGEVFISHAQIKSLFRKPWCYAKHFSNFSFLRSASNLTGDKRVSKFNVTIFKIFEVSHFSYVIFISTQQILSTFPNKQ